MKKYQKGQALVMLLFFIMMGIIITTAAIFIIAENSLAVGSTEMGVIARQNADTGVESALLSILRGNYAHQDIMLSDGTASVDITVVNGNPTLISSTGRVGNYIRKVEVNVSYIDNVLMVGTWKEIN